MLDRIRIWIFANIWIRIRIHWFIRVVYTSCSLPGFGRTRRQRTRLSRNKSPRCTAARRWWRIRPTARILVRMTTSTFRVSGVCARVPAGNNVICKWWKYIYVYQIICILSLNWNIEMTLSSNLTEGGCRKCQGRNLYWRVHLRSGCIHRRKHFKKEGKKTPLECLEAAMWQFPWAVPSCILGSSDFCGSLSQVNLGWHQNSRSRL